MELDFITAAESHYKAKMDEAGLTMRIYMNSAAGVGEHPQVFEEFRNALESFQEAREVFNLVQELKSQYLKAQEAKEEEDEN